MKNPVRIMRCFQELPLPPLKVSIYVVLRRVAPGLVKPSARNIYIYIPARSVSPSPRSSRRHNLSARAAQDELNLQRGEPAPTARPRAVQSREEEDGPRLLARAGGRRVQTRRLGSNDGHTRTRLVPSSPRSSPSPRLQLYKRPTTSHHHHHHHHCSRIRPRRNSDNNDDHAADGDGSPPLTRRRDSRLRIRLYAQLPLGRARVTPPVSPRASSPYHNHHQQRQ